MKKLFTLIMVMFITLSAFAQSPQKMSYQCVVRNASGVLVTNQSIGIRISILQGTHTGSVVYQETYNPNPQTNGNGLISIEIGGGIPIIGIFSAINWASGPYFLKTETDPAGGTNYSITGTNQLLSVPYALYAITSKKANELELELQKLTNSVLAGGMVTDIDGNSYHTVKIGTQVWMAENLRTTKKNDGTSIPLVTDNTAWYNLVENYVTVSVAPGFCWYNNDMAQYKKIYGALYNWSSIYQLCPIGWHVPSRAEWTALENTLGGSSVAGGHLKEAGISHWADPNSNADNSSSFNALPGGFRGPDGNFVSLGYIGYWWTSDFDYRITDYSRKMEYNNSSVSSQISHTNSGFSVRCVKN